VSRLGVVLLAANLAALVVFLLVYRPVPAGYEGLVKMRHGQLTFDVSSADPHLFAGRELYWHQGESAATRLFALLNLPAALGMTLFGAALWRVRPFLSPIDRSWFEAAAFLVFMTGQWLLIGRSIDALRARVGEKHVSA